MNRLSSHSTVIKGFRRLSGVNREFQGGLLRTAGARGGSRRRSGGELELRLRRSLRRAHRRQPYPLQTGPDRGRIGQGGEALVESQ